MKCSSHNSSHARGFTLLEVLVSAAIGTGVILMMAMTMRLGSDGFSEATRRIDAIVEARAAMGVLADDVSTIIGNGDEAFGWAENSERFHEVWFLTLKPIEAQDVNAAVGDVCFVHYFTAITLDSPVVDAGISRKLYRRFISSADMLEQLRSGGLLRPEADPDRAEAVAFNVTRFVVQPLTGAERALPLVEWMPGAGLPDSLDVSFQVVDGETARTLRTQQDWELSTTLAQTLVLENEDATESLRGRDFNMNIEIGHDD